MVQKRIAQSSCYKEGDTQQLNEERSRYIFFLNHGETEASYFNFEKKELGRRKMSRFRREVVG